MKPPRESTLCLHRVSELPLDLTHPVYAHYTTVKLGVAASVDYYARLLAPLVERAIATDPDCRDWVLTAPAYDALPAAANLLCEAVHDLVRGALPPATGLDRVDIRQRPVDPGHWEVRRSDQYSKLGWRERRRSRAYWHSLLIDQPAFAGRAVIFVNDINVSGAQRDGMRDWFAGIGAASVTWVYIVDVDEAIGRAEPQIEYAINKSTPLSVEQLADILQDPGLRLTSKGVGDLLSLDDADLGRLLALLDEAGREKLLRQAKADGRYAAPRFAPKLELLTRACGRLVVPGT